MTLVELLHSAELDPQILADFRDALNRVRNTAWVPSSTRTVRRAIKTQVMFFRSWRENEFVPPTTFAEPLMKI
jgi:hypothetical protein